MRFTVKAKLGLAFALVIVVSAATAWIGVSSLAALNQTLDDLLTGPAERVQMAQDLYAELLLTVRAEKNLLLAGNNAEEKTRFDAEDLNERQALSGQLDKLGAVATAEGKRRLAVLNTTKQQWIETNDRVRALARDNQAADALALSIGRGRELATELEKQTKDYTTLQQDYMKEAKDAAGRQYDSARFTLTAATLVGLVLGAGAAVWIALSIARGLGRAGMLAQGVAGGDLTRTADVTTRDEIGDLIGHVNTMVERLRVVVTEAATAGENVSSGSQQLSASRSRCRRARPSKPQRRSKRLPQWSRWRRTSNRTPITRHRPRRSLANQHSTRRKAAKQWPMPCRRCRPSLKRSPSCKRLPGKPTCWR